MILGKLRLRALMPPRDPSLSPGWPWVLLTGHPCSCLQTQSVTRGPRPQPGKPVCSPGPPPPLVLGFSGQGPSCTQLAKGGGLGT